MVQINEIQQTAKNTSREAVYNSARTTLNTLLESSADSALKFSTRIIALILIVLIQLGEGYNGDENHEVWSLKNCLRQYFAPTSIACPERFQ